VDDRVRAFENCRVKDAGFGVPLCFATCGSTPHEPHDLVAALVRGGVPVSTWQPHRRTLEELYMGLSAR